MYQPPYHSPTISFDGLAFRFLRDNKERFYEFFEREQVDARIVFITKHYAYEAAEKQNKQVFNKAIAILEEFPDTQLYEYKEMDGRVTMWEMLSHRTLNLKMYFFNKSSEKEKYEKAELEYIDKIWNDADALNFVAWDYYENYEDKASLERAKGWVIRSIELNSNYHNNDTYAALLYKLGEYDAALLQAETTISIAKKNGNDYQETTELIEKINKKIKR